MKGLKALALLWKNRKALKTLLSAGTHLKEVYMKSSIKSMEFWLTAISSIGMVYAAIQGMLPPELTLKIAAALVATFTIARTVLKVAGTIVAATPTDKDDKILEKVASVIDKAQDALLPGKTIDPK